MSSEAKSISPDKVYDSRFLESAELIRNEMRRKRSVRALKKEIQQKCGNQEEKTMTLYETVLNGDTDKLQDILKSADLANTEKLDGSPLHCAICGAKKLGEDKAMAVTKLLISANPAWLWKRTKLTERTPLHFASATGDVALVNFLLSYKSDLDSDRPHRIPLSNAAATNTEQGHSELMPELIHHWSNCIDVLRRNPLFYVSQGPKNFSSAKIVQSLLDVDSNCKRDERLTSDRYNQTALHMAVADENIFVLNALLSDSFFAEKAMIEHSDIDGRTALFFAFKNAEIWKRLTDPPISANQSARDNGNRYPHLRTTAKPAESHTKADLPGQFDSGFDEYENHGNERTICEAQSDGKGNMVAQMVKKTQN